MQRFVIPPSLDRFVKSKKLFLALERPGLFVEQLVSVINTIKLILP